ncbi:hypothetical protein ACFE04_005463 [Oxalis oulophora]
MGSSKTLMDFFQPDTKRIKLSSDSSSKIIKASASSSSIDGDTGGLTSEQKSRIEFNKLLAKSKQNLKLCSQIVSKAKGEALAYPRLGDLLVDQTWLDAIPGELDKPYFNNLCKFVESEMSGNVQIFPPQHLIFNALNTTSFDNVKAVIIGQDPYHGPGQAMGLSFSVLEGVKVPSSLVNIFKELNKDLGCSIPAHGNLQKWAVQGVLLLNAVLTVRCHQANSHQKKGWEQFTDAVIKTISLKKEGIVFLLWGNSAQEKLRLIDQKRHHILKAAHPSGLSAHRGFFGCKHFSRTNQLLEQMRTFVECTSTYLETPFAVGQFNPSLLVFVFNLSNFRRYLANGHQVLGCGNPAKQFGDFSQEPANNLM